jgi:hypothetical protein
MDICQAGTLQFDFDNVTSLHSSFLSVGNQATLHQKPCWRNVRSQRIDYYMPERIRSFIYTTHESPAMPEQLYSNKARLGFVYK